MIWRNAQGIFCSGMMMNYDDDDDDDDDDDFTSERKYISFHLRDEGLQLCDWHASNHHYFLRRPSIF